MTHVSLLSLLLILSHPHTGPVLPLLLMFVLQLTDGDTLSECTMGVVTSKCIICLTKKRLAQATSILHVSTT